MPIRCAFIILFSLGLIQGLTHAQDRPNVVFMMADDLGYGELGCYGQKRIRTPNLDRMAARGMRFMQHYSGAPVCAPARCVLMTGRKSSHAEIRGNTPARPEGQRPITAEAVTVAELMKSKGYVTGAIGKWGLGPVSSTGDPNSQGFDLFYGYNCQREAHNYFPGHLWHNRERQELSNKKFRAHQKLKSAPESYEQFRSKDYAPDLMMDMTERFLRENKDKPFFLYLPFVEPHLAMQPKPEIVASYPEEWDEKPYLGTRGYLPHPRPRAGYAAMITDLDDHVGRVLSLLEELDLSKNTLMIFTSDNGPTHDVGGVDTEFFNSSGGLRGRKGSMWEGGLRVPFIAEWPGRIKPGTQSDHMSSFEDLMATMADLTEAEAPDVCDGISYLPTLIGRPGQKVHPYLNWEFFGYKGQQAVRMGRFKGVRQRMKALNHKIQLFDLDKDPGETRDISQFHPDIIDRMDQIMRTDRTANPTYPLKLLDG